MATSYLSPNMSLVLPVPTQQPGPNWAYDLNASLTTLDGHNHSSGSGVQIVPSGININSDLTFNNSNNAIGLRSSRYFINATTLATASDLSCAYSAGAQGDLYWNDGLGNQVRITQSGNVAGAAGTITGLPSGTASASYVSLSGTFQFQQATSTGANIDAASLIIRYPGSYPTPSGNAIILQAPSSLSSQYSLTLPSLPAQTNVMTLTTAGVIGSVTFDTVGQTMTSVGANAIIATSSNPTFTASSYVGLGASAKPFVANNVAGPGYSLGVIRGFVAAVSAHINSGEGFSVVRTGVGLYTVTYTNAFADVPAVTGVSAAGSAVFAIVSSNTGLFNLNLTVPTTGAGTDTDFMFIVMGRLA